MALKYRQTFVVEGSGLFPYDMLRYDGCFPRSESESPLLGGGHDAEFRQIELQRYVEVVHDQPTEGRWRSFGWHVKDGSVKNERF